MTRFFGPDPFSPPLFSSVSCLLRPVALRLHTSSTAVVSEFRSHSLQLSGGATKKRLSDKSWKLKITLPERIPAGMK